MSDIYLALNAKLIMFKFQIAQETPLPRWLTEQAHVAATPVNPERERLLREDDKEKDKKCHRRLRTFMIVATLLLAASLLVILIILVYQATSTVTSARDTVAGKVALLINTTETVALDAKASINALRGVSQRAELFSATSFDDLANATRHVHSMAEYMDRVSKRPLSLSLVGR